MTHRKIRYQCKPRRIPRQMNWNHQSHPKRPNLDQKYTWLRQNTKEIVVMIQVRMKHSMIFRSVSMKVAESIDFYQHLAWCSTDEICQIKVSCIDDLLFIRFANSRHTVGCIFTFFYLSEVSFLVTRSLPLDISLLLSIESTWMILSLSRWSRRLYFETSVSLQCESVCLSWHQGYQRAESSNQRILPLPS